MPAPIPNQPRYFYLLGCGHSGATIYERAEQDGRLGLTSLDGDFFYLMGCSNCGQIGRFVSIQPIGEAR
jgi:hypothetical protein